MKEPLKSLLNNLINDRLEEAKGKLKDFSFMDEMYRDPK